MPKPKVSEVPTRLQWVRSDAMHVLSTEEVDFLQKYAELCSLYNMEFQVLEAQGVTSIVLSDINDPFKADLFYGLEYNR